MAKEKFKYKDPIRYGVIEQYEAENKYAYKRNLKAMEIALIKKVNSFKNEIR